MKQGHADLQNACASPTNPGLRQCNMADSGLLAEGWNGKLRRGAGMLNGSRRIGGLRTSGESDR